MAASDDFSDKRNIGCGISVLILLQILNMSHVAQLSVVTTQDWYYFSVKLLLINNPSTLLPFLSSNVPLMLAVTVHLHVCQPFDCKTCVHI